MSHATLLVIQGVDQGARFALDGAEIELGRGTTSGVRLHDTEVSRTHAHIKLVDGHYRLVDLQSSNGTFVNGSLVQERGLAHGDEIQLGRSVLLFERAPAPRNESQLVADRVTLLGEEDARDRSAIVGQATVHESSELAAAVPGTQTLANLQVLYRITEEAVRPSNSIEQLLSRILELTIEVVGADRGCILLRDAQSDELTPQVFRHRSGLKDTGRMPVSRSIVEYVHVNLQGVRTTDARTDVRFTPGESILQAGIREAICVPMQGRYDMQGAIYVDITTPPERALIEGGAVERFNEDLLRLMVAIGRQSALAVEDNRYRQALVKAERLAAVGQTIAILSHHIKNILQGVRGGSYLIDMGLKEHNEEFVGKGWHIVEKNQNKIYNLVMDMLTLSKERQLVMRRGDLNATVGEVRELLQGRADEAGVRFEWSPAGELPPLMFDAEGIHRAALNIAVNAFDAVEGRDGARIRLSTGWNRDTGMVTVTVEDNGPGIPPALLPNIFNLFESTKGARGTGIGLSVSRKIIREHGGDIHVESRPGAGASFTLEWPLTEDEAPAIESETHSGG